MTFLILKRCCFCNTVKTGSFIIAYLLLVARIVKTVLTSLGLSGVDSKLVKYQNMAMLHEVLGFNRMILCFELLLIAFELLMCVALLYGLYKKLPDILQLFYVGDIFFFGLHLILQVAVHMHYGHIMYKKYNTTLWLIYAAEFVMRILYFYFLVVIRSYSHELELQGRKDDKIKFFTKSQKV